MDDIQGTVMMSSILKSAVSCEPPFMFRESHFPIVSVSYAHIDNEYVFEN